MTSNPNDRTRLGLRPSRRGPLRSQRQARHRQLHAMRRPGVVLPSNQDPGTT